MEPTEGLLWFLSDLSRISVSEIHPPTVSWAATLGWEGQAKGPMCLAACHKAVSLALADTSWPCLSVLGKALLEAGCSLTSLGHVLCGNLEKQSE